MPCAKIKINYYSQGNNLITYLFVFSIPSPVLYLRPECLHYFTKLTCGAKRDAHPYSLTLRCGWVIMPRPAAQVWLPEAVSAQDRAQEGSDRVDLPLKDSRNSFIYLFIFVIYGVYTFPLGVISYRVNILSYPRCEGVLYAFPPLFIYICHLYNIYRRMV